MFPGISDVDEGGGGWDGGVTGHHHHVRVGGEKVDECRKFGVANLHGLKMRRQFTEI